MTTARRLREVFGPRWRDADVWPTGTKQEWPKTVANRLRRRLAVEQCWLCHYCRRPMTEPSRCGGEQLPTDLTLEHIHPASRGGRTTPENCVAACRACNAAKGSGDHPYRGAVRLADGPTH